MNRFFKTTHLKSFVVFLLIISTILCSSFPIQADELSDKQNEKDNVQSNLDNNQQQQDELEDQLGSSENALAQAEREKRIQESIKQDRIAELTALKNDIEALDEEIIKAEADFAEKEALFLERAKVMYQYSDYSMIDMLLQSDNIFMFFEKISTYKKMLNYDKELMNEVAGMKATLAHKKKLQEDTFANQEILIAQIDKAIDEIDNNIELKQEEYADLIAALDKLEAEEESLAGDLENIDNEIARLEYEEQLKREEEARRKQEEEERRRQEEEEAKRQQEEAEKNNSNADESSGSNEEESSSENSTSSSENENVSYGSTSSSGYLFPVSTSGYVYYSSKYGYRTHPISGIYKFHSGIDLAAHEGTPIYAIADGVVTISRYDGNGYGKWVEIQHDDGTLSRYAHASELYVSAGERVRQGQTIAAVGMTGTATGNHLHFEILKGGQTVNPIEYISLPW